MCGELHRELRSDDIPHSKGTIGSLTGLQSDQVVAFVKSLVGGDLQRGGRLRGHGGGGGGGGHAGGSHQVAPNELDLHGLPV